MQNEEAKELNQTPAKDIGSNSNEEKVDDDDESSSLSIKSGGDPQAGVSLLRLISFDSSSGSTEERHVS